VGLWVNSIQRAEPHRGVARHDVQGKTVVARGEGRTHSRGVWRFIFPVKTRSFAVKTFFSTLFSAFFCSENTEPPPGGLIGYMDHTGCHVDHTGCHVDHTGWHHLVCFSIRPTTSAGLFRSASFEYVLKLTRQLTRRGG
jgi:hypothetical protein